MTTLWQGALRAVAELGPAKVLRWDVRRKGPLHVELQRDGVVAWYRVDEQGCHECRPEQDEAVPLGACLTALRDQAEVEVLSHRPGRRLVVRVGGGVVLKGYRRRRLAAAAARHRLAQQALGAGPVRAPGLRRVDEQRACLVLEQVVGRPLDLRGENHDSFSRIGAVLRRMQDRGSIDGMPRHGPEAELDVLDGLAAAVGSVGVGWPASWEAVRARLSPPAGTTAAVLAHRDLHDRQFVVGRDIVLLDFDQACAADPLLDVANLIVHLRLREWQGVVGADPRGTSRCGRALLDGLDREGEHDYAQRLRFYQAATLLRLALIYSLRPRWSHLVGDMVDLARRCAEES